MKEVVRIPGFGAALLPGARGFQKGALYRLNASYEPLQLFIGLGQELPDGPWQEIAKQIPDLVRQSSPHGFVSDWSEFRPPKGLTPSAPGSYDAIRVYLWAGMLPPETDGREAILQALSGMARYLHTNAVPPAKIKTEGTVEVPNSSVGFSAALLPYLSAVGEKNLENEQMARLQAGFNSNSGLYGNPTKYYDQNLALFALGWKLRQFWFDSQGRLILAWKNG